MPFLDALVNNSQDLTVSRNINSAEMAKGTVEIAKGLLLEIFDHFGWNPDANQIKNDQEAFFRREFH